MGYGGAQKVSSVLSDELSRENDVTFYVVNSNVKNFEPHKARTIWENSNKESNKLVYAKKKILAKLNREDPEWSWVYKSDAIKINHLIESSDFNTIILVENAILFASNIRSKFPNLRIISWVHSNYEVYTKVFFKHRKQELFNALKHSDYTVALTRKDAECFTKATECKNVIFIHNPVTITSSRISLRRENIITYTGSIKHIKGYDHLAKVAELLPESWRIEIAGDGEIRDLKNLLAKTNSTRKVIFLGNIDENDLIQHYQRGTIHVMTSRYEGFPLVLGEAMSFGLPIVAFDQSGAREVLCNGEYGFLIKNGDIDLMMSKIYGLINNKQLQDTYSKKSLERAEQLKVSTILKEWEKII